MLKLYHWWSSTCSRRVRIALAAKGLTWESVYVNLAKFENLDPSYVKLNPNGVVPTLVHDGRIIIESNFILEYLDDVWPEVPLRPDDPYERAQMRIWMDRFEHELHRNVNIISFIKQGRIKRYEHMSEEERQAAVMQQPTEPKRALLADRLRNGISEEQMAYAEARLAEILDEVEKALQGRPLAQRRPHVPGGLFHRPVHRAVRSEQAGAAGGLDHASGGGRLVGSDAGDGGLPHRLFLQGTGGVGRAASPPCGGHRTRCTGGFKPARTRMRTHTRSAKRPHPTRNATLRWG